MKGKRGTNNDDEENSPNFNGKLSAGAQRQYMSMISNR